MKRTQQTTSLTVRFPSDLHRAASQAAARAHVSLNAWLRDAAEQRVKEEEERELFDSFSRLADEPSECDVEFAWQAQREAIERGTV
jgi:HicB family